MNIFAADIVAAELKAAIEAHRRAVDGPDARTETDARDRVERAAEAAAALLSLVERRPGQRASGELLSAGQPVLWLNSADTDDVTILRATVLTEDHHNPPGAQTERRFEIVAESPWGPGVRTIAPASHLIPLPTAEAGVRRAG